MFPFHLRRNWCLLLLLMVFITISDVFGALAVNNTTNSKTAGATSLTWSHTCTGTNRVLIVGVVATNGVTISGVTYGGSAMSSIASVSSGARAHRMFRLTNPATGANDVVVTVSASSIILGGAISFTGNDNNSLNGTGTGSGTNTSCSGTNAVTAGEMVLDMVSTDDQSLTVGALQTDHVNINETYYLGMSTEPEAGSSPLTMSWSFAASDSYTHTR